MPGTAPAASFGELAELAIAARTPALTVRVTVASAQATNYRQVSGPVWQGGRELPRCHCPGLFAARNRRLAPGRGERDVPPVVAAGQVHRAKHVVDRKSAVQAERGCGC